MLSLQTNASLAIVTWLVLTGAPARADDLLVMPYTCSMIDGQPVLRRSRDEGHRVIGRREQRNFTACSTVNPDMCRQWTVYRFDLDCDGARVPWLSVAAEAARGRRNDRTWVEDGRLRIDMGPRWGMSPDDPCARGFAYGDYAYDEPRRGGRIQRYCADRRALGDASIVDMPPGFAPMLGIDGIFVAGGAPATASAPAGASPPPFKGMGAESSPPQSEPAQKSARVEGHSPTLAEPAAKSARVEAAPPPPAEPASKSARTESPAPPPPDPAAKSARFPNLPANLPPGTPVPAKSAIGQESTASPRAAPPVESKPAESKPASPPAQASTPVTTSSGPVVPKIINRPAAPAPAEASSQPSPVTVVSKAAATPEPGPKLAVITPPPPKETITPEKPAQTVAVKKDEAVPVTIFSVMPSPAVGATIVVGLLAVLLLAAFALTRRRERVQLAGRPRRDIAAVSLDRRAGTAPVPSVAHKDDEQIWAQAAQAPPEPAPAEKPSMRSNWGERIPRTREEALQILGMGVTPDANLAAIKKIVDGLRASWHPDHASGQGDRQMRELRMKQINAAWEIIAGKRAVA